MTTTLTITSGQASFTAQNYTILPSPGTAVPDNLVNAILQAAQTAGVVLSSSAGVGVVTVPARRFVGTGTGSPTAGSWQLGDELVDSTGAEYECIAAGSPGTWVAAQSGTFAPLKPAFYDDFTSKGTAALSAADSGGSYTTVANGATGAGMSIIGGKLTNTATGAVTVAGYVQQQLSGNVRRIGGRFGFGAGATTGALNLAIWKTSITSWPTIPDSAVHLSFGPANYGISTFTGNSVSQLAGPFTWPTPLAQDGTLYEIEVVVDDYGDIYVCRPDGVWDGPFAAPVANLGPYTNHEVFQNNGSTEAKGFFTAIWADTEVVS